MNQPWDLETQKLLDPIEQPSIAQLEAEALPIEHRVAAYGAAHHLEADAAIWALCELGLQMRVQQALMGGEPIPVYLWASYKALTAEAESAKEAAPGEREARI